MADISVSESTHIQDALDIALEREEAAVEFYRKGAEMASDAGVKALFAALAEEEKGHVKRIQGFIDKEIMREM